MFLSVRIIYFLLYDYLYYLNCLLYKLVIFKKMFLRYGILVFFGLFVFIWLESNLEFSNYNLEYSIFRINLVRF